MKARFIGKCMLSFLLVGIVVSYAAFRFVDYREGSNIAITYPKNGATLQSPLVNIQGSADRISYISLNGREITTDKAGNFTEKLLLHPGYNALSVQVTDRFGRVKHKTLELVYHEPNVGATDGFAFKKTKNNPS